jgi:hypothetical protein
MSLSTRRRPEWESVSWEPIPATLADFKIDHPSLLSIAVKNEMPVKVDTTWRPAP